MSEKEAHRQCRIFYNFVTCEYVCAHGVVVATDADLANVVPWKEYR